MKKSELIKKYESQIEEAMVSAYEHVLRCEGRIAVDIMVNDDGDVWQRETLQGDHSYIAGSDYTYITTVEHTPQESVFEFCEERIPEDERTDEAEDELIKWYVDDYRHETVRDVIDALYREAVTIERYED